MKQSLLATAITLVFSGMALADGHMASGTDISKAIAGNTVQGSMMDAGAYTEFYAADGMIKGDGYSGSWRVQDDTMCFDYGTDPEACWSVAIEGDQVTWIRGGKKDGTGTIVPGNPNNF